MGQCKVVNLASNPQQPKYLPVRQINQIHAANKQHFGQRPVQLVTGQNWNPRFDNEELRAYQSNEIKTKILKKMAIRSETENFGDHKDKSKISIPTHYSVLVPHIKKTTRVQRMTVRNTNLRNMQ